MPKAVVLKLWPASESSVELVKSHRCPSPTWTFWIRIPGVEPDGLWTSQAPQVILKYPKALEAWSQHGCGSYRWRRVGSHFGREAAATGAWRTQRTLRNNFLLRPYLPLTKRSYEGLEIPSFRHVLLLTELSCAVRMTNAYLLKAVKIAHIFSESRIESTGGWGEWGMNKKLLLNRYRVSVWGW